MTERGAADEYHLRRERETLEVTLKSIGDAVIVTDVAGRVTFLNPVAERITGWPMADARNQPFEKIFHIVNEHTGAPVEHPVRKVPGDRWHRRAGQPYDSDRPGRAARPDR